MKMLATDLKNITGLGRHMLRVRVGPIYLFTHWLNKSDILIYYTQWRFNVRLLINEAQVVRW